MQKASLFLHKAFGTSPNDGDIQPKEIIGYSIAGFGQNLICTVIGSYLTVFMTDAIGFSALSVALLMLFARVYDAFNDPIMGSIVDRTRSKWGKCRPYLKWMVIPIALCTIACFLPVYPATKAGFALISTVYVIWGMVYTVADVPYWGLSSALTSDTHKRGILLTVARLACTLGGGIVTIVVPQITAAITAKYTPETVQQPLSM
ncbi:MAG TPA: MFS transporter, partial [Clostridia bacterium]|nr:MFS transporter [Clostridia bacterium]